MIADIDNISHKKHVPAPMSPQRKSRAPGLDLVPHKRRGPTDRPPSAPKEEKGRRTFHIPPMYEAKGNYLRINQEPLGVQQGPDLRQTRFGAGFMRRTPATVDLIAPNPKWGWEAQSAPRKEKAADWRRERLSHIDTRNGYNPITLGPPLVSAGEPTQAPPLKSLGIRPAHRILEENRKPKDTPEGILLAQQRAAIRCEKLGHEGLFYTKKDWSVADQFSTYDGYKVPREVSNEGCKGTFKRYNSPIKAGLPQPSAPVPTSDASSGAKETIPSA